MWEILHEFTQQFNVVLDWILVEITIQALSFWEEAYFQQWGIYFWQEKIIYLKQPINFVWALFNKFSAMR